MDHQDTKRTSIITAALQLFSAKGYDGTGMSEIIAESGAAKGTIYHFFESKEKLYAAVWAEHFPELFSLVESSATYKPKPNEYDKDVFPVLVSVMNTFFTYAQNHAEFYHLLLSSLFITPNTSGATIAMLYHERLTALLTQMFTEMSAYHGNMKSHEKRIARTFYAIIQMNAYQKDNNATDIVSQFMHGIFS